MLVETFNSAAKHENIMELDNSIQQSSNNNNEDDDDDDENSPTITNEEFPPLPTDIDVQSCENASDTYDNRQNTMELLDCPSPPLPPPPPPPSATTTVERKHRNSNTFTSIHATHSPSQSIVTFSTQYKKKNRAPIVSFLDNIYVNMPRTLPPEVPIVSKPSISIPNEVIYATLINTSSLITTNPPDQPVNHVEYQQIRHKSKQTTDLRIYENVPCRRPPPPPCQSSQDTPQRPTSWSIIPVENEQSASIPTNEHIYINLEYQNDQPPIPPKRTTKTVRIASPPILASPPPPAIPPRQDLKENGRCPSTSVTLVPTDDDQDMLETSSNASTLKVSRIFLFLIKSTNINVNHFRPLKTFQQILLLNPIVNLLR